MPRDEAPHALAVGDRSPLLIGAAVVGPELDLCSIGGRLPGNVPALVRGVAVDDAEEAAAGRDELPLRVRLRRGARPLLDGSAVDGSPVLGVDTVLARRVHDAVPRVGGWEGFVLVVV